MRIKGDGNDRNIKEVLHAFPRDSISPQIKGTEQDVVHLRHLGPLLNQVANSNVEPMTARCSLTSTPDDQLLKKLS